MSTTAIKERPILFSALMIHALLTGRKTQTRRVVKPQPKSQNVGMVNAAYCGEPDVWLVDGAVSEFTIGGETLPYWKCPYGRAGDRLWVRETWGVGTRPCPTEGWVEGIEYRADNHPEMDEHESLPLHSVNVPQNITLDIYRAGWHASIHMPRWASRLTLEIVDVRAERLQQITEADAQAEGVERPELTSGIVEGMEPPFNRVHPMTGDYADGFKNLWNDINGADAWDKNPWVWVISFSVIPRV
jgi:hypothetical protein